MPLEVIAPDRPRVNAIHIVNNKDEIPLAIFNRELFYLINGTPVTQGAQQVTKMLLPEMLEQTIALRNPVDDALTGSTVTYGEMFAVIYSLARQVCDEFDAAQLPQPEPPQ